MPSPTMTASPQETENKTGNFKTKTNQTLLDTDGFSVIILSLWVNMGLLLLLLYGGFFGLFTKQKITLDTEVVLI